MGLLGGILVFTNRDLELSAILHRIIEVQRHRDRGTEIVNIDTSSAIGMINSQDTIFNKNGMNCIGNNYLNNIGGVYAFVDGIVLNIPKHVKYFEDKGYSIPFPLCSLIVAYAYQEWGNNFMYHLEGEFSCVVWDSKQRKVILVRDPYGHKPLHYYIDRNMCVFASEIKGLLAVPIPKEISLISLSDFLSLNCIPYPATMFQGVKQVAPGQIVIISSEGVEFIQYWSPKLYEDSALTLEDARELLTDGVRQAVKKRLVTDKVYCFLSGGIDSSAVLSFASELSSNKVNAVTVSFEEAEANELEDAKAMANYVGAKHYHVTASPSSFFDMLDTLVYHHDQPFTDTSAYPSFYAGKLASGLTDIILTGDGPDQTLGGSDHHVFAMRNNIFRSRSHIRCALAGLSARGLSLIAGNPSTSMFFKLRRKFYRESLSAVTAAYDIRSYFPDLVKQCLFSNEIWKEHTKNNPFRHPEAWFEDAASNSALNRYLYADIKFYIPDDLMIKVDRMSMAHGLETLSPFQDIELARIVSRFPIDFKLRCTKDGSILTKYILREICKQRFPDVILNKKKQGFGIPLEKWLRHDKGRMLKDILLDPVTVNRGYYNRKQFIKFVNDFVDGRGDYYYPSPSGIVALVTLELWHRKYLC